MGMYDIVEVPCPKCGELFQAQSKSGACALDIYSLGDAPQSVLDNVNRHAPFECENCGTKFRVKLIYRPGSRPIAE